jgi:hypothetical protein
MIIEAPVQREGERVDESFVAEGKMGPLPTKPVSSPSANQKSIEKKAKETR